MVKQRMAWADARAIGDELAYALQPHRTDFAGSLRRLEPEVGDLDLLIECDGLHQLQDVVGLKWVSGGSERATLEWMGMRVDAWQVHPRTWGSMLLWYTGPAQYNIWYAKKARQKGMKLSGRGLYQGNKLIAAETEESVFNALGKEWKSPQFRGK